ncbi:hypothetical protein R1sor_016240 [Riccia sorocarpa]|uniref:Pescadillo homolog n=1 Tax=Riccia sorocarpa TaxID=122646 RepID=A0ABD3HGG2_9MARC
MVKSTKKKVTKAQKSKQYLPPGKRKLGNVAKYTTRNKALNRLQIKLPEFRRLCILKGIHPREPKKKFEGQNKTYYHVKDINFLAHEPLLEKDRDLKAYEKKIKKAKAKKNRELAERFDRLRPTYTLDHLVKERYPSFIDALRDMDDPLTMLHLFATLPADNVQKIPVERVQTARRLSLEWQAYVTRTNSLRKIFVSVKGIYYQVDINGQKITWLTPHALSQVLPSDVDFRVMLTFVEFYETLVGFVNFKLYHSLGISYPPIIDQRLERATAGVEELMEVVNSDGTSDELEDEETLRCKTLFKDLKFFLAREVPRDSLLFTIRSFGGKVSWDGDGAPYEENDETITHQIVDRPTQGHKFLSRDYVQPQWVYDSCNARILLPAEEYVLGRVPPPHLSPFVDNEAEGYIPEYGETIKRLQAASANHVLPLPGTEEEMVDRSEEEAALRRSEAAEVAAKEQEAVAMERTYGEELAKELAGVSYSASLQDQDDKDAMEDEKQERKQQVVPPPAAEDETATLAQMMMPKKTKKLYEAMQMGIGKKKAGVELLKQRKKKVEEKKKGSSS